MEFIIKCASLQNLHLSLQEEFDDLDQEVEFEPIEEFYHGPRVHALSWSPTTSLNKLPKSVEICAAGSDFSLRVFGSDIATKRHSRQVTAHLIFIASNLSY